MSVEYEQALQRWGAKRLEQIVAVRRGTGGLYGDHVIDPARVRVTLEFDEGYQCCGGAIEGCYCSLAESPRAEVIITDGIVRSTLDAADFDFVTFLKEVLEA